jgi:DNA replication protein DnaC
MTAAALTGRDSDLDVVRAFLDDVSGSGAALLLTGEPGVGKTALLDAVHDSAIAADVRVLRAAGVEFEADVSCPWLRNSPSSVLHARTRCRSPWA